MSAGERPRPDGGTLFDCVKCDEPLSPKKHGWLTCFYCRKRVHTTCAKQAIGRVNCGCHDA